MTIRGYFTKDFTWYGTENFMAQRGVADLCGEMGLNLTEQETSTRTWTYMK